MVRRMSFSADSGRIPGAMAASVALATPTSRTPAKKRPLAADVDDAKIECNGAAVTVLCAKRRGPA